MFSDVLDSSPAQRLRRAWMALTSFGLQALVTAALLLFPLLMPPAGLTSFHQLSTPVSLPQPSPMTSPERAHPGSRIAPAGATEFLFRRPSPLPIGLRPQTDDGPPPITGTSLYIPGAVERGSPDGINLPGGTQPVLPAVPPPSAAHPLRLSHISEGSLIRKVQPAYPPLARSARIQGTVVLEAIISKQGTIENLTVVAGHPVLVKAALDAVRQWLYRPYILNNEPVEVETQITVNFFLAGN